MIPNPMGGPGNQVNVYVDNGNYSQKSLSGNLPSLHSPRNYRQVRIFRAGGKSQKQANQIILITCVSFSLFALSLGRGKFLLSLLNSYSILFYWLMNHDWYYMYLAIRHNCLFFFWSNYYYFSMQSETCGRMQSSEAIYLYISFRTACFYIIVSLRCQISHYFPHYPLARVPLHLNSLNRYLEYYLFQKVTCFKIF